MSGSIQSSNYVPGVSGWKLNAVSGDFEINSAQIQVGTLPSDPQLITVTAGCWSEYDLPANALERLAFIGAELEKIPAECRASAEFTTEDISFDSDGSDVRTSLTYERHETAEEVAARQARAKVAGTRITQKGGLTTISIDGVARFRCGDLTKAEQPQPFVVSDGQVFVDQALIDDGSITKTEVGDSESPKPRAGFYRPIPGVFVDADGRVCVKRDDAASDGGVDSKLAANWSLKMQVSDSGQYVVSGIGLGLPSQFLVSADRFAINDRSASDILRDIAGKIGDTKLGQDLKEQVDLLGSNLAEQVKTVIRKELMPGGLLHRSS